MSNTTDAEIDEILQSYWYECRELHSTKGKAVDHASVKAKAKLQALLLREREKELTKFHDVIWPFEPHEPCPYCMGESYSVEHSYYDDRLAKLSRLSGEGKDE